MAQQFQGFYSEKCFLLHISDMAAVIRVKRRIDEEPQNAFVLKKRKTDDPSNIHQHSSYLSNSCETNTILKFAGTVDSQVKIYKLYFRHHCAMVAHVISLIKDDSITSHISKLTKDEAKLIATKTRVPTNSTVRCREEAKQSSQENRFKIVNCYRASDENQPAESKGITVVDVESNTPPKQENTQTSSALSSSSATATQAYAQESPDNFVYDLYLTDTNDLTGIDTNLVDDLLRFVYGGHVVISSTII